MSLLKFLPVVATVAKVDSSKENVTSVCVVVDSVAYWCVCFGSLGEGLRDRVNKGSQLFIEEWGLKVKDKYKDIIINKCSVIK